MHHTDGIPVMNKKTESMGKYQKNNLFAENLKAPQTVRSIFKVTERGEWKEAQRFHKVGYHQCLPPCEKRKRQKTVGTEWRSGEDREQLEVPNVLRQNTELRAPWESEIVMSRVLHTGKT